MSVINHDANNSSRQENYLKSTPARSRNLDGAEKTLKDLRLMDRAASSISDGDLVDALIHGYVVFIFIYFLLELFFLTFHQLNIL